MRREGRVGTGWRRHVIFEPHGQATLLLRHFHRLSSLPHSPLVVSGIYRCLREGRWPIVTTMDGRERVKSTGNEIGRYMMREEKWENRHGHRVGLWAFIGLSHLVTRNWTCHNCRRARTRPIQKGLSTLPSPVLVAVTALKPPATASCCLRWNPQPCASRPRYLSHPSIYSPSAPICDCLLFPPSPVPGFRVLVSTASC